MEDSQEEESLSCSNISFKLIMIGILIYMNSRCNKFIHQFYPYFKRAIRYKNGENILLDIKTKWGETLDINNILQEYPRPQFVRESYMNLNGEWDCSLIKIENTTETILYKGKIIVPFPIESRLSGVENLSLNPGMILYYKKIVDLSKLENQGKYLLHFGAVDQTATLYINNKYVGEHDGGYHPFYFDITNYIEDKTKVEILLKVIDNYSANGAAFGKQGDPRRSIFYQKIGGIWQTVWIESVPNIYIKDVKITPNYDGHSVSFFMILDENVNDYNFIGKIKIFDENKVVINSGDLIPNQEINITLPNDFRSWSPEDPFLYKVEYIYGKDEVKSYFGMRKFSIGPDENNIMRLFLNNKPYFQNGVLDQGFWSDGIYTAPSDEALKYDIQTMKNLGFNMLRKHIKIEPKRWYYHCDTLGMLVWQDQPSGGSYPYNRADESFFYTDDDYELYNRTNLIGRLNFIRDLNRTLDNLYNSPCISTWVPFNEGWGQFDSVKIAKMVKSIDKTRFVDHVSGYVDHFGPDFRSLHIYFDTIKIEKDEMNRPIVLSEYGGYGLRIKGHLGSTEQFSYIMHKNKEELTKSIANLIKNEIYPNMIKGLCAAVYTQLSDVEQEINGFLTYDRKVIKVNENEIREANGLIKFR